MTLCSRLIINTILHECHDSIYYGNLPEYRTLEKQSPKKLKDSYVGPFVIVALHGTNADLVELSGESENEHPTFPVRLIKPYQPADKEFFPLRNPTPLTVPPVEQSEDKKIKKVITKGHLGVKIKENIFSDIEIQYMKMNGWQNQIYLTQINS
ncbi:hypothetical protein O181_091190 [Austropuccinia psidii MF-1]|uniref:Uncharacterized protein n=1 Tax=Austropuccinia psidii MF-1 TaxID=1389203 RepID=A0A9Q3IWD2_9BASI|nr:hypothetical protein [Austropuccinia psidii MF-1]